MMAPREEWFRLRDICVLHCVEVEFVNKKGSGRN